MYIKRETGYSHAKYNVLTIQGISAIIHAHKKQDTLMAGVMSLLFKVKLPLCMCVWGAGNETTM